MTRCLILAAILAALTLVLAACGKASLTTAAAHPGAGSPPSATAAPPATASGLTLPALPKDGVQPWEKLDSRGYVVPSSSDSGRARAASSMPSSSSFLYGAERFLNGGSVSNMSDASAITSGAPGGRQLSWAMYRFALGGVQPGTLAVDADLHPLGAATGPYWVAISDYSSNSWRWLGPYSDGQVTLTLPAGNYLSPLGNCFVTVVAFDGPQLEVVALLLSPLNAADATPPPAPAAAPVLTPVDGGLEAQWLDVVAGDLAGYRIYYSFSPFSAPSDHGVQSLPYLENTTLALLKLPPRFTFVAIAAVDVNGNEGPISQIASALPKPGAIPALALTYSAVSVLRNQSATLTATGADSYDWDVDGDGVYDITGDTTGSVSIDTSKTGVIRPRVIGHGDGNKAIALGSVSLVVSGNQRPVAVAQVSPQNAIAGVTTVNLTGHDSTDTDGSIVKYDWDADGDGIFEYTSPSVADTTFNYAKKGTYNAKLRVTDNQGAWDVDGAAINVVPDLMPVLATPGAVDPGGLVQLTATSPLPPTDFKWDLDENGTYETDTGASNTASLTLSAPGWHNIPALATVAGGVDIQGFARVLVHGWKITPNITGAGTGSLHIALSEVGGLPAVAYADGSTGELMYQRAVRSDGSLWNSPVVLDAGGGDVVGLYPSLVLVANHPAVAYQDSTTGNLKYVRAADATGGTWGAPVPVDSSAHAVGIYATMVVVDGKPAIAYEDATVPNALYVRALTANGSSWGVPVIPIPVHTSGRSLALAEVSGAPAILTEDNTSGNMVYVRATDLDGASWGTPVILGAVTSNFGCSLAEIDGHPAALYDQNAVGLTFTRSSDSTGVVWLYAAQLESSTAILPSLVESAGVPFMFYASTTTGATYRAALGQDADGLTLTYSNLATWNSLTTPSRTLVGADLAGQAGAAYLNTITGTFDFAIRY